MIGGGGGGANTDRVAESHCKGEGAGGGCAPPTWNVKLKLPPFYKAKRGPLQHYKKHSSRSSTLENLF